MSDKLNPERKKKHKLFTQMYILCAVFNSYLSKAHIVLAVKLA